MFTNLHVNTTNAKRKKIKSLKKCNQTTLYGHNSEKSLEQAAHVNQGFNRETLSGRVICHVIKSNVPFTFPFCFSCSSQPLKAGARKTKGCYRVPKQKLGETVIFVPDFSFLNTNRPDAERASEQTNQGRSNRGTRQSWFPGAASAFQIVFFPQPSLDYFYSRVPMSNALFTLAQSSSPHRVACLPSTICTQLARVCACLCVKLPQSFPEFSPIFLFENSCPPPRIVSRTHT